MATTAANNDARLAHELVQRLNSESRVQGGIVGAWLRQKGYRGNVSAFISAYAHLFEHRIDNYVYLQMAARPAAVVAPVRSQSVLNEEGVVRRVVTALEGGPVRLTNFPNYVSSGDMGYIRNTHISLKRFLTRYNTLFQIGGTPGAGNETCSLTPEGVRRYLTISGQQGTSSEPASAPQTLANAHAPQSAAGPSTSASTSTAHATMKSEERPSGSEASVASPAASVTPSATPLRTALAAHSSRTPFLQLDPSSEPVPVHLVDTCDAFVAAKARLEASEALAIDCEMDGSENKACLALVQVYVSTSSFPRPCIYVFDVFSEIGHESVVAVWRAVCNDRVKKVFHDGRRDIDAIRYTVAQYGATSANIGDVQGIVDVQVLHGLVLHFRGNAGKRRAGFSEVMEFVGLPGNPFKAEMRVRFERKEQTLWTRRPIESDLLSYAAWDVLPLLAASERLEKAVAEAAVGLAHRSSAFAAEEFRQATYKTRGGFEVRLNNDYVIVRFNEYRNAFEYVSVDDGGIFEDVALAELGVVNDLTDEQESERETELMLAVLPEHVRRLIESTQNDMSRVNGEAVSVCEIRIDEGKPVSVLFNDTAETQHTFDTAYCSVAAIVKSLRDMCARKNNFNGDDDGDYDDYNDDENEVDGRPRRSVAFGRDNRVGIEGTLHRISAIRDKARNIVGLTMRIGNGIRGAAYILRDVVSSILPSVEGLDPQSLLLVGRPGVGKTTYLRDIARRLADDHGVAQRVVVVDKSGEIGGEGRVAHGALGKARRMHVADQLSHVLIEAVQNHNPRVLVVDEIGEASHVRAVTTIAQRGTALVGTAHGTSLVSLLRNPDLRVLVGDVTTTTVGDAMAKELSRDRGDAMRKTKTERKGAPVFSRLVEVRRRKHVVIHWSVAGTVDALLSGECNNKGVVEERWYDPECRLWKARFSIVSREGALGELGGVIGSGGDGGDSWVSRLLGETLSPVKN